MKTPLPAFAAGPEKLAYPVAMILIPSISTLVSICVIAGVVFALLRRSWTSFAVVLYVLGFVLLASVVKQAYLGTAVTLADMRFFLRPMENFRLFITYPLLGATLLGVLAGVAACVVAGFRFERPVVWLSRPRTGIWMRLVIGVGAVALGLGASIAAVQDSNARVNDGDAYAAFLSMYAQQHPGGPIGRLNVFFNNRTFAATLPPARSQSRFIAPPANTEVGQRPDIMLVLEESTFDAMLIANCPATDCDNVMMHPLSAADRTQQGPLLVHTTGGGTWLAEFAIMAGLDWRAFGRGGAYAPVSLAPRLKKSLPNYLRSLGYRTVAVYPTDGNFLSAMTAYVDYGFDEFYDRKMLGFPDEWGDTTDAMVFDKALQLARRDDRPLFMFVLTIRNHGPHGGDPAKVPRAFQGVAQQTSISIADYLARTRDSSRALVAVSAEWLKSPRPRVLAWFGDHQPEAAWDFTKFRDKLRADRIAPNANDAQLQYLTRYQFSANFGPKERTLNKEALDLSYIGSELLHFAGLPLDASAIAARQTAAECKGLMMDCADRELVGDYLSYRVHELREVE